MDKPPRRLTFLVLDAPLRPSTVVVARDPLVRSGLCAVLAAYPGLVLKEALGSSEPGLVADVVVWDAPEALPPALVPTLVLVSAPDEARAALRAGALGALSRSAPAETIAPAAVAVASGHRVVDAAFASALLDLDTAALAAPAPSPPLLSRREDEVLALMAEGLSNRDIAERLGISRHTAKFHVNAILDKLGATTRTEAVVLAARGGLLTL
jgi:DNA-binding NarL/FixJ family response regulator